MAVEQPKPVDPEKKEPQPTADHPAPRLLAVGVFVALAVGFAGVWVMRRK